MKKSTAGVGILLSFFCLLLLGIMPIICNSRPDRGSALGFAFILSLWQLLFALPLFLHELQGGARGVFGDAVSGRVLVRLGIVNVLTGFMFGLATWFYVVSIERAGAVNAAIAIQAYPLFALLVEMVLLRQKKSPRQLTLTGILVVALYYLGTGGRWRIEGLSVWFLLALCIPLLWAIAHVLIREELLTQPISPAQVTFFRVLLSTVFLGGLLSLTEPGALKILFDAELLPFGAAMGFCYFLELIIWFHAVRHIEVSLASSITTPWPAVTMLLAVIFLNETIAPYQLVAFCFVGGCIYLLLTAAAGKARSRDRALDTRPTIDRSSGN